MEKVVEYWTRANAAFTDADARRAWAEHEVSWGMWAAPEAELGVPGDVSRLDAVELGCGTAFASARLARLGAKVVVVDPTPAQLETARRMHDEFDLAFPLIDAFAEDVPLPDASFDLAHEQLLGLYVISFDQVAAGGTDARETAAVARAAPTRRSLTVRDRGRHQPLGALEHGAVAAGHPQRSRKRVGCKSQPSLVFARARET